MKPIIMKLHPRWRDHTGHCQVTYVSRHDAGHRLTYCLQWQGRGWTPEIRLMRCSDDGEPSHEVAFTMRKAIFERPMGDSDLEIKVREWIDSYEAESKGG